jgi:hypothetical protein
LSEGAGEESENEVKACVGVDDGVEDGIDNWCWSERRGWRNILLMERGLKFVQLLEFVQVGMFVLGCSYWVFKLVSSRWVFKFVRSSWGVQVGAFCEFLVSFL